MSLTLQPLQVATGSDEESMLVFAQDRLVAVLVHLSDESEAAPGDWYLEVGFGPSLESRGGLTFPSLDAAQDWIAERLSQKRTVAKYSHS